VAYTTVSPPRCGRARWGCGPADRSKTADAKTPRPKEWPICTMTVAMPDADWAKLDPEFAAGKKAVVAEDWGWLRFAGADNPAALHAIPHNADKSRTTLAMPIGGLAPDRARRSRHYQQGAGCSNPRPSQCPRTSRRSPPGAWRSGHRPSSILAHLQDICLIGCEGVRDDLKRGDRGGIRGWWLAESVQRGRSKQAHPSPINPRAQGLPPC